MKWPGLVAAAAAGLAVGAIAERLVVGRWRSDAEADEKFGSLRSQPLTVVAHDGVRIHVEVEEPPSFSPGDDLTIVFCHGYALNQDSWHYQRRDLRDLGRLVFWDQRSHGRSDRSSKDASVIDQLGHDLSEVLNAVAPSGPIVLVGHSMGGMTIMALMAHQPEIFGPRVKGVALVSTSPGGLGDVLLGLPPQVSKLLHRAAPVVMERVSLQEALIEVARSRSTDLNYYLTARYAFGGKVPPSVSQFTIDMLNATPLAVVSEFLPAFDAHDKREALIALSHVEATIICGTKDVMTPARHSVQMSEAVPSAELVLLEDAGHMLMLERYSEVNSSIRKLVGRVRASMQSEASAPELSGEAVHETA